MVSMSEKKCAETTKLNRDGSGDKNLEGYLLYIVFSGLLLCFFLPDLDQLILTTATPQIVSEFNVLTEISWIPNAYFLTMASFMIIYGQLLNLLPIKHVIFGSIFIFELGSLFCGIAFNTNFLLLGRAVAGVGGAGLWVCVVAAISQIATIEKRAKLLGFCGLTFGFSSLIGPIVGGALTERVTWRWCFLINLPIGLVAAAIIFIFLPNYPAPPKPADRQGWKVLYSIDYVGAVLAIAITLLFLYPLVKGGSTDPWDSGIVIACFISSGVLLALFLTWSWYRGTAAILPLYLLKNKSIVGLSLANCFIWMNSTLGSVYLATWYQVVKGDSPTQSGLDIIPFSLIVSGVATLTGLIIGKMGRYWHILLLMPLVGAVGAGLEFSSNEDTSKVKLVVYQVLWAVSIGATMQLPMLAVNAEYPQSMADVRYATSLVSFVGFVGQMVGLGMGNALFINKLSDNLQKIAPDAPLDLVLHSIDAIGQLPADQRTRVIHAYVLSLRFIFILGVPAAGLSTLSALLVRDLRLTTEKSAQSLRETARTSNNNEEGS